MQLEDVKDAAAANQGNAMGAELGGEHPPAGEAATLCAAAGAASPDVDAYFEGGELLEVQVAPPVPTAAAVPARFAVGDRALVLDGAPQDRLIGGVCVVLSNEGRGFYRLEVPKDRHRLVGPQAVVHGDFATSMAAFPSSRRRTRGTR